MREKHQPPFLPHIIPPNPGFRDLSAKSKFLGHVDKLICGAMRDHFSTDKAASGELMNINDPIANVGWRRMSRKATNHPYPKPLEKLISSFWSLREAICPHGLAVT
ncbi:hypothetical protein N9Z02_00915 [Akkermansiaceae bacterium]|nr:hypothetical protein [Akkermansiaceae bacterium]